MNNKNITKPGDVIWTCPGFDYHLLPGEVYEKELACLSDSNLLCDLAKEVARSNQEKAYILPLVLGQEALAFGASVKKCGNYWSLSDYPFRSLQDLAKYLSEKESGIIGRKKSIQALYEAVRSLKETEKEIVIVEVQGPFSLLASLVDPMAVYSSMIEEAELLAKILGRLTEELCLHIKRLADCGCSVISLADPMGKAEYTGKELYKSYIGPYNRELLIACQSRLDHAIIHLCGHMSSDLLGARFIECLPLNLDQKISYYENLSSFAGNPQINYIGFGCIHCQLAEQKCVYSLFCDNQ